MCGNLSRLATATNKDGDNRLAFVEAGYKNSCVGVSENCGGSRNDVGGKKKKCGERIGRSRERGTEGARCQRRSAHELNFMPLCVKTIVSVCCCFVCSKAQSRVDMKTTSVNCLANTAR